MLDTITISFESNIPTKGIIIVTILSKRIQGRIEKQYKNKPHFHKEFNMCDSVVFINNKVYYFYKDYQGTDLLELRRQNARIAANIIRVLRELNVENAYIDNAESCVDIISIVYGLYLGFYKYNFYKTTRNYKNINIYLNPSSVSPLDNIDDIETMTKIIYHIRNFTNEPANLASPKYCSNIVDDMLPFVETLDYNELVSREMNGIVSVSSNKEAYVNIIDYKPNNKIKNTIIFVGKGVTYDTGGYSIKPTESMVKMKSDKAGAGVVFGTMRYIYANSELFPNTRVISLMGFVENLISDKSYKPGDVIKMFNGQTVEITNTDAEGRLVLADLLTLGQSMLNENDKNVTIIDIATLTGAAAVGFGPHNIVAIGNDSHTLEQFQNEGGGLEQIATLKLDHSLKPQLKSNIADMVNCSTEKQGGAITAGLFLENFINEKYKYRWLHLDICGPAYLKNEYGIYPSGATAAGLYSVIKYIKAISAADVKELYLK